MNIKGSAALRANDSDMQLEITNAVITDARLGNLSSADRRCQECLEPIIEGEEAFIIFPAALSKEREFFLNDPFVIHKKGKSTGSCVEDFLARLIKAA